MDIEDAKSLLGCDVIDNIATEAEAIGVSLKDCLQDAAIYAAERVEVLSAAMSEPGFELALKAERDNIALKVAISAVERADEIDARILAVTRSSLVLAARGLKIIVGIAAV